MGIGGYVIISVDNLLFLHMERCKVDRQSRLFHGSLPIRVADCSFNSWYYIARRHGGYSILYQSKFIQASGIWGKLFSFTRSWNLFCLRHSISTTIVCFPSSFPKNSHNFYENWIFVNLIENSKYNMLYILSSWWKVSMVTTFNNWPFDLYEALLVKSV